MKRNNFHEFKKSILNTETASMKSSLWIILLTLISCVSQPQVKESNSTTSTEECQISAEVEALSDPQSLDEAMAFIAALPKPIELKCLLKSLKRPLEINATSSMSSAQPASGSNNPRIFIFKGDLIISIVPDGIGKDHVEFSELIGGNLSIKGELALPVTTDVTIKSPYARILNGTATGTSCRGCHGSETQTTTIDGVPVFQSKAFKPLASKNVPLASLNQQLYYCDFYNDSNERCEIFRALLKNGTVTERDFPPTLPTMFDP